MSEKRRASKGRILRNGECQRKDGLYQEVQRNIDDGIVPYGGQLTVLEPMLTT